MAPDCAGFTGIFYNGEIHKLEIRKYPSTSLRVKKIEIRK
jgi:hypothetical protein